MEKLKPIKSSRFKEQMARGLGLCGVPTIMKSVKIYIVDDASFICILCRYHLSKAGYSIIGESFDGNTAQAEILASQPDCVIVDLALPLKSGAEIIKNVQAQYPHIQFIIITALDKDILDTTEPELGYSEYLRKPFEAADLIRSVKKVEKGLVRKSHG